MADKREKWILMAVLPFIAVLLLAVWSVKPRVDEVRTIDSKAGTWDLAAAGFEQSAVRLDGDVEYVPDALLSPEEFSRRGDIQAGQPGDETQYATSRMRLIIPSGSYLICGYSVDFASRMYVNGELLFEAGAPGDSRESARPGVKFFVLPVSPDENGEIVIVQQASNFIHKDGGSYGHFYIGTPEQIDQYISRNLWPEVILMGVYLVLFVVHLILYLMMRNYKPNLLFALFCLTWFVRTGVTGQRLLDVILPKLPWVVLFRLEYLTMPLSGILLVWLLYLIFPGVLQKWFSLAASILCGAVAVLDVFASTLLISYTAVWRVVLLGVIALYFFVRLILRWRRPAAEQAAVLSGFAFLVFAAVWDMCYHRDVFLLPALRFAISEVAIAVFVLFAMTAMFFGTMREVRMAREREERMAAEKAAAEELARLKGEFYTDLSHEMKTPLTVMVANAEFAARNIRAGAIDEETGVDLDAIAAEGRRLAKLVNGLVNLNRMRDKGAQDTVVSLAKLTEETARTYKALAEKQGSRLSVEIESGLPAVNGNADQLAQVVINLLANAGRHTRDGVITVSLRRESGRLRLEVADTGDGISPEILPHIFDRFCRGDESGTGLGLAICREIIENHGGKIDIQSDMGKGTTVWFTLPVIGE
ncbi:sensor histidine kinase [[Clostridium] hylemonae]|uniref:histidine kinase n=1 Tax=[Clostridium] hylemonae DSM 15053 TaxID=553973 RepID=C0C4B0_9FIRM|nr:sensor histidine kinase [[Clostridium] hylemonae]EEG72903.1 ATPase/histidine kinase/DNA gyrase B/HSP90 domain protein [[Clostridium] hylemonae DSM 15053]QEK16342.1 Sensor protein SrrB [[Clostridium] hylemonae DSM 15053]